MRMERPCLTWGLIAILFVATFICLIREIANLSYVLLYAVAINVITYMIFCYDKTTAPIAEEHPEQVTRVPNCMLILLAVAGGSLGALLGICLLGHKTNVAKYWWLQAIVLAAFLVQAALAGYWLFDWMGYGEQVRMGLLRLWETRSWP